MTKNLRNVGRWLLLLCLTFVSLAGCAKSGPEVVPVSGTVTRAGSPVPNLLLNFKPADGRPSWGLTNEEGKFSLSYTRNQVGARVGEHTVWVIFSPRAKDPLEEAEIQAGRKKVAMHQEMAEIQKKYGAEATTPLRIKIDQPIENLVITLD